MAAQDQDKEAAHKDGHSQGKEKPAIVGLAAAGMPSGSPGMDVPNSPPYDVVSFDKNGKIAVFATHTPK